MIENNYLVHPKDSLQETLKHMNRLENIALNNVVFRQFVFREFFQFRNCVDCLIKKLWEYVIKNFKYVEDTPDELIQAPYILLKTRKGDCDDFSLFIKSVLKACGVESNYFLMGKTPEGFTHVAVLANEKVIDGANSKFNYVKPDYINFAVVT